MICLRNAEKKPTHTLHWELRDMDARERRLGISAVQLHHKVIQPLCLRAEQAQERQLLLSPNVSGETLGAPKVALL